MRNKIRKKNFWQKTEVRAKNQYKFWYNQYIKCLNQHNENYIILTHQILQIEFFVKNGIFYKQKSNLAKNPNFDKNPNFYQKKFFLLKIVNFSKNFFVRNQIFWSKIQIFWSRIQLFVRNQNLRSVTGW